MLSEKANMLSSTKRQYVFQVSSNSNKLQIKSAIEKKFEVKVDKVRTINYKGKFINGKKTGVWVGYYYNGQLEYKGSFKNGKKDGIWEFYSSNGMKYNEFSGIYKNGNKISKAL